jgi:hypothetical protein
LATTSKQGKPQLDDQRRNNRGSNQQQANEKESRSSTIDAITIAAAIGRKQTKKI